MFHSISHLKWQYAIYIATRSNNNLLCETVMVIFLLGQSHMTLLMVLRPFWTLPLACAC